MQRALDELVADGAPGALAELRDETGTWRLTSGVAELGAEGPIDALSHIRVGSVTKAFTATAVLQLVGDGRLTLSDTVDRWLPGVVPNGAEITVRHLLSHTSGLYNYTDEVNAETILRDRYRQWTLDEIVAKACRHEPRFPPGSSRAYNNTGYFVLALVIEAAGRRPYSDHVQHRILEPLGLRDTIIDDATELPRPHAHGYLVLDDELVDITSYNPSVAGPAGAMTSTAADVNVFFANLLSGDLLAPAQLREMLTTMPTDMPGVDAGLGLSRCRLPDGGSVWARDGGFFGFKTWSFHSADAGRQLTISVTTAFGTPPKTPELLARVANVFTGS